MSKEELIQFEGLVIEILPDARYRVRLDAGYEVLAYTAGKMKKKRIKTLVGDRVTIEMSSRTCRCMGSDPSRGYKQTSITIHLDGSRRVMRSVPTMVVRAFNSLAVVGFGERAPRNLPRTLAFSAQRRD